jgi:hypothetical protein
MKHTILISLLLAIWTSTGLGGWYDCGWKTYKQPNGVAFSAWMYGDEYEYHFEAKDGYAIGKNPSDGFYYYASGKLNNNRYVLSNMRVGIDPPNGLPKHLYIAVGSRPTAPRGIIGSSAVGLRKTATSYMTVKILLVEFQDIKGRTKYTKTDFQNLISGTNYSTTPDDEQTFGSVAHFYDRMSNGQLSVTGTMVNPTGQGDKPVWLTIPHTKSEYNIHTYDFYDDAVAAAQNAGYDVSVNYPTTGLCLIYAGNMYHGPEDTVGLLPHACVDYIGGGNYYFFYIMSE